MENQHRKVTISPSAWDELIGAIEPDDRFIGDADELILVTPNATRLHIFRRTIVEEKEALWKWNNPWPDPNAQRTAIKEIMAHHRIRHPDCPFCRADGTGETGHPAPSE